VGDFALVPRAGAGLNRRRQPDMCPAGNIFTAFLFFWKNRDPFSKEGLGAADLLGLQGFRQILWLYVFS
jgi:hypothetical protein